jgi:hypothetical protein
MAAIIKKCLIKRPFLFAAQAAPVPIHSGDGSI